MRRDRPGLRLTRPCSRSSPPKDVAASGRHLHHLGRGPPGPAEGLRAAHAVVGAGAPTRSILWLGGRRAGLRGRAAGARATRRAGRLGQCRAPASGSSRATSRWRRTSLRTPAARAFKAIAFGRLPLQLPMIRSALQGRPDAERTAASAAYPADSLARMTDPPRLRAGLAPRTPAPADVDPVPAHPARGPGRRRGAEPPAAGARRLHPPGRARHLHLAAARAAGCCATSSDIVREEMDAIGAQEVHFPALLPREPYEATEPLDRVRRQHLPAQGPQGRRLPARAHPRGDVHAAREGPVLVVQGPAAVALPDPDQVPRRGAAPRRPAARPRVRDEGLLLLRRRRRRPRSASYDAHRDAYIRIFDRLGLDYVIVEAMSGAMGGSASEEFLASAEVGEDTYVRCTDLRLRRQRRGGRGCRVPGAVPYDDAPGRARRGHPGHPDDRDAGRPPQRAVPPRRPALDRRRHAEERAGHARATPTARREPLAIGVPGDREVDLKRLEAQLEPAEVEPLHRGRLRGAPRAGQGLHRPGRARERARPASATWSTPGSSTGTRWVTGANDAGPARPRPGRRPRLHRRRHHRGGRGARRATPARCETAARRRARAARGIEMGHIFQLGRKYAEALDLQVLDENGKLVTVTMGSYGIGVSRAVAAIAENTHDELGLVWPREVAPADVHLVATGKDDAVFEAAERLADELVERRASTVLYDDRPKVSPGREVQGRRADRRADDRRGRPGPGRRRRRGQGPGDRRAGRGAARRGARPRRRPGAGWPGWLSRRGTRRRGGDLRLGRHADAVAHRRPPRGGACARPGGAADAGPDAAEALRAAADAVVGAAPATSTAARRSTTSSTAAGLTHDEGLLDGVPRVLGAAHRHRPRRAAAVPAGCAADGLQVGVLSNTVWPRGLARGVLRARRRPRPDRRRGLHQRDPVDQAVARGVPRRDGGGRRRRPGALRLRRRPALRRHLGRRRSGMRADPRAALATSRSSSSGTPRASRTRSRTGSPRSTRSSRRWRLQAPKAGRTPRTAYMPC